MERLGGLQRSACALVLAALLAMTTWLHGGGRALAADIARGGIGPCTISLSGIIREGDASRLSAALQDLEHADWIVVCLNSPGGDYFEALSMIDTMLKARASVGTRIDRGSRCFSACALVFLAGHYGKKAVKPFRRLDALAQLGFHGPYISPDDAEYDPAVAAQAFQAGVQSVARLIALARDDLFPPELLMLALQKGYDESLLIETVDQAGKWDIDIIGFKPVKPINQRMVFQACANIMEWTQPGNSLDNETKPEPIVFRQGVYRARHPDFGDEALWTCVADVIELPNSGYLLEVQWSQGDDESSIRSPAALKRAAQARTRAPVGGPGRPLWMLFDRTLTLKKIAGPDPR